MSRYDKYTVPFGDVGLVAFTADNFAVLDDLAKKFFDRDFFPFDFGVQGRSLEAEASMPSIKMIAHDIKNLFEYILTLVI